MTHSSRETPLSINPTLTLVTVILTAFAYKGLETVLSPAIPLVQKSLGATEAEIAWVITGVLLSGAVATPLVGRLSDVRDKKKLLQIVLAIVALGVAVSGLSTSILMLTVGQLLQGVGLAVIPLAFGIIRDTQSESRIKSGNGWVIGFIYAGTAVALIGSGVIVSMLPWRWLFAVPFTILVIILLASVRFVPSCPPAKHGSVDYPGAALLGSGLVVLLVGLTKAPEWGWFSGAFIASVLGCTALLSIFVAVELRRDEPLIDMRLFATRPIAISCLVYFQVGFCTNMMFMAVPMLVQQPTDTGYGLGVTEFGTALLLLPLAVGGVAAALVTKWIDATLGSRLTAIVAVALGGAAFLCLILADGRPAMVLLATTLVGVTGAISLTQAMNTVVLTTPESRIGAFSGLAFVVKAVAGTLGVQLAGSILASGNAPLGSPTWGTFQAVLYMGLFICGIVAALCILLPKHNHISATADEAAPAPANR